MTSPNPSGQAADFDPHWYLWAYPDVAAAGLDPWFHYDTYGREEGRLGRAPPVTAAERDLWSGFAEDGILALEAETRSQNRETSDTAHWALARWYFAEGDLDQAAAHCRMMLPDDQTVSPGTDVGRLVLAAHVALGHDDPARARAMLGLARKAKLSPAECDLVDANISGRPLEALNGIWRRAGLGRLCLPPGAHPAFDRLARPKLSLPDRPRRKAPVVSVVVPAFNAGATLPTALASLAGQRWKALEVIVVDDGSTDQTRAIADRFADADPRFRVVSSPRNEGAYPARNRGAAAARGAYITVLDADDWAHPDRILQQVRPLIADPFLRGSLSHWVRAREDLFFTDWRIEEGGLIHRNVSSLMIRRAVLNELGYWDRVRVGADTEYYYRLIAAYGSACLREVLPGTPLSLGRIQADSLTTQPETHIRSTFGGLRAAYHDASQRWHARAQKSRPSHAGTHALHLPEHPARRPFAAPAGITIGAQTAEEDRDDVIRNSPLFDASWYLAAHPDVRHSAMDPALNYLNGGAENGLDPSPRLSTSGYRLAYLEQSEEKNPILHWHKEGQAQELAPLPTFEGAYANEAPTCLFFGHQARAELFGAERCLLVALDRLVADGEMPVVVLPQIFNRSYLQALLERCARVKIVPYPWRHAQRIYHADTLGALDTLVREVAPREVHINTLVVDAPVQAARGRGIPIIYHVHERPDHDPALCEALGADASTIRGWLLSEADRFVANSVGVQAWLADPERTTIAANRIDPALFDMPLPGERAPSVAMISSNIAKKGIADFVDMAEQIAARGLDNPCLLIGPESSDLAALRPLPAIVQTPGYADAPAKALEQADIVVNLSRFAESFGLTVLEAMAAARPVVCYSRGNLEELVEDGVSGFLVPPDDPVAAARAVIRLLEDPALRAKISAGARERARALLPV
ncbi:MAG: glycosyltransferase [Pseudomonadota bacterium]